MIHYCVQGRIPAHFPIRSLPRIARECSLVRKAIQSKPQDVSISFVTAAKIQKLNQTYRGIDRPTDVLSFSPAVASLPKFQIPNSKFQADLGDLFICLPYVVAEAKRRQEDLNTECIRMVVHGTLHLMGMDHATAKDEKKMFGLQEKIIKTVSGKR
jgi:probable rRNA maturation factor